MLSTVGMKHRATVLSARATWKWLLLHACLMAHVKSRIRQTLEEAVCCFFFCKLLEVEGISSVGTDADLGWLKSDFADEKYENPREVSGLQTVTQPVHGRADLNLGILASEFVGTFSTLFWKPWGCAIQKLGEESCLEAKEDQDWKLSVRFSDICLLLWWSEKTYLSWLRTYGEVRKGRQISMILSRTSAGKVRREELVHSKWQTWTGKISHGNDLI